LVGFFSRVTKGRSVWGNWRKSEPETATQKHPVTLLARLEKKRRTERPDRGLKMREKQKETQERKVKPLETFLKNSFVRAKTMITIRPSQRGGGENSREAWQKKKLKERITVKSGQKRNDKEGKDGERSICSASSFRTTQVLC